MVWYDSTILERTHQHVTSINEILLIISTEATEDADERDALRQSNPFLTHLTAS